MVIPIEPVAKGRPRLARGGFVYTPKETRIFERKVSEYLRLKYWGTPLTGPVFFSINFYLTKPKSVKRKYPSVRPDADNFIKALLDACNGILFKDDAQIVVLNAAKIYGEPRIEILMHELD